MRELGVRDVARGMGRVLRRGAPPLLLLHGQAALVIVGLGLALMEWTRVVGFSDYVLSLRHGSSMTGSILYDFAFLFASLYVYVEATGAAVASANAAYDDERMGATRAFSRVDGRRMDLFGAMASLWLLPLLVTAAILVLPLARADEAIALSRVVRGVLFAFFALAVPYAVLEGLPWGESAARSATASRGSRLTLALCGAFILLVTLVPRLALEAALGDYAFLAGAPLLVRMLAPAVVPTILLALEGILLTAFMVAAYRALRDGPEKEGEKAPGQ